MSQHVLLGDCREVLRVLPDASIDSIVTDPPYELGFMGKGWDKSGVAFDSATWRAMFSLLKPGGHLLAFSGTRTYHRMVCAIEDAGFEIRDQIGWVYGSGFPKSLDVSKAIDKAAGVEREVTREGQTKAPEDAGKFDSASSAARERRDNPATDAARQWQGWGTALKPSHEPIVVARKPLIGTVAANVLQFGTGAINVDGCRVPTGEAEENPSIARRRGATNHLSSRSAAEAQAEGKMESRQSPEAFRRERAGEAFGRWPANLIHDGSDEVLAAFPGGESRFFYVPKASRKDRDRGLHSIEDVMLEPFAGEKWAQEGLRVRLLVDTGLSPPRVTAVFGAPTRDAIEWSTILFGNEPTGLSPADTTFTIETETSSTTDFTTLSYFQRLRTSENTEGAGSMNEACGGSRAANAERLTGSITTTNARMGLALGAGPAAYKMRLKISVSAMRSDHPTVKPTELMRYLCRLVTPPGGLVLDPFAGSGSTGVAAALEGFRFIGIDMTPEYVEIARARIRGAA